MLLKLFKGIHPSVIGLIFVSAVGIWMNTMLNPVDSNFLFNSNPMPLYGILIRYISPESLAGTFLSMIIWIIQGFLLVRLNTKFFFINERTYLPAIIFILSSFFIEDLQMLNPVIFSSIFLLLAVEKMLDTYQTNKIYSKFFDAGLLLGVGMMFYINIGLFLIVIWIGMLIFRIVNWRELLLPVLGLCTPGLITVVIYYLLYGDLNLLYELIKLNISSFNYYIDQYQLYFLGYLALLFVFASSQIIRDFTRKKVRSRKIFKMFWWVFIINIAFFFVVPWASYELVVLGFIPFTYLLTNYFVKIRVKWAGEVAFFFYAGGLVFTHFAEKLI